MFKRKQPLNPNTTDTLIGEGTVFEGTLKSEASIRIEGKIVGDIECKGDVTIGEQGSADSNIHARNVLIAGTVKGNITAKEKLTIHAKGKLQGNTTCQTLVIDEGGSFMGNSKMGAKEADKESKPETDQKNAPGGYRSFNDSAANL